MRNWVTVPEVFRELGREPTPAHTWSVGAIIRDMWEREFDRLPEKALRPKTNDGGTHMFAVYPPNWRDKIAEVVRSLETEAARQMELFA